MDLLKTLLVYMTMVYASSVQSMPDAEAYMATVVTPTPAVTATAEPTPRPTAVPTVEVSVNPDYHTIQTGDKGDEVLRLQQALAEYGYMRVIWTAVSASRPGGRWNAFNTTTA